MSSESVQDVLALFDRTVWIITASADGAQGGLVATFVQNASLVAAAPRVVAGIAAHHHTWQLITRSHAFAAHLVAREHADLLWRFGLASGKTVDKFAGVPCRRGETGSPILDSCLAWLDCRVEAAFDIGDRSLFLGSVIDGGISGTGAPLTAAQLFALATPEQRAQMDDDRRRDEAADHQAIRQWRDRR